jgi:hypothetical protein
MPFRHQSHFNRMRYRRPHHLQRQRFPEPNDSHLRFEMSENSPMYQSGHGSLNNESEKFGGSLLPKSTFSDDCDQMINLSETPVKRISLGDYTVARRLQFDDEEYEPMPVSDRRYSLASLESTENNVSLSSSTEDDDSSSSFSLPSKSKFQTAYVAAVVQYVQIGKQRTERRCAYGIWSDNSEL